MSDRPPFTAAVVQTLAKLGDVKANIDIVRKYVEQAAVSGADLIVFPECMNSGYLFDDEPHCRTVAETVDGEYASELQALSSRFGVHIVSGMTELGKDDDCLYNSAIMTDPHGDLIGHYQKQFLATHDNNWFEVGSRGCSVVETELGRIGLLICFDGRIPEIARLLALAGADIIVDVANFFEMDQADQWVPARAYENGVWFVASTKSGVERSIYYPGGSQVVGPDGIVRSSVPLDSHGIAVAEVDVSLAREKRWLQGGDRIRDRRAEHYSLLQVPFEQTPVAEYLKQPLVPEQVTVKGAAVQAHSLGSDGSLDEAIEMVEHSARLGVKLLVLPQYFAHGSWRPSVNDVQLSQAAQERAWAAVSAICHSYSAAAVLPLAHVSAGRVSQCTSIIGPDGEEMARLSQVHPEPWSSAEPTGEGFSVIKTPFGRLGVLLGYDGMFPESARVLALLGADVIAWPCAWESALQRQLLTVTKAEDNRCFLIACNRTDSPYSGGSIVVGPNGFPHWDVNTVVPPTDRHGAVFPAFLNLALSRQKSMIPGVDVLRNRLVRTYAPLVQHVAHT